MKVKTLLITATFLIVSIGCFSQSMQFGWNRYSDALIDRIDIMNPSVDFHSSVKPYQRGQAVNLYGVGSDMDDEYLEKDNAIFLNDQLLPKRNSGFFSNFYREPAYLYAFKNDYLEFVVNPILNLSFGKERNSSRLVYQNSRGIELYGTLDEKLHVYTSVLETQRHFYNYIEQKIDNQRAIPGQGFYKPFESSLSDNLNGWDYLNAKARITYSLTDHVRLSFGQDNHFIGNGYQSLLLSDYGNNYLSLVLDANFWIIRYKSIFAELAGYGAYDNESNTLLPKKYMAAHYLDFKIHPNFSLGLFEAVVFNRQDHFEFQYLNPIIFYRVVEQLLDSPDNVLIGMNLSWNIRKQLQLYGQFMLDELVVGEFVSGSGWWGNKYGVQLGAKWVNSFGVDHLDMRLEFNLVRPYTYQHREVYSEDLPITLAGYHHYKQPLAHPLGANFNEILTELRYQPHPKWIVELYGSYAKTGFDIASTDNYGQDILLSYFTRVKDENNSIAQGDATSIIQTRAKVSYELFHNGFIDVTALFRNQNSDVRSDIQTHFIGTAIRINISDQRLDY